MEILIQDVRFALRSLRRTPGFVAVVVAVLALGIGVNTMIFSMVYGCLLRPWPLPRFERVMTVLEANKQQDIKHNSVSWLNYLDLRDQAKSFSAVGGFWDGKGQVTIGEDPEQMQYANISSGVLPALGVTPQLGRTFTRDEEVYGQNWKNALISDRVWKKRFGGTPDVLGKTLKLERPRAHDHRRVAGRLQLARSRRLLDSDGDVAGGRGAACRPSDTARGAAAGERQRATGERRGRGAVHASPPAEPEGDEGLDGERGPVPAGSTPGHRADDAHHVDRGRAGAAHRLRERRQPDAGTGRRAQARDERAPGTGGITRARGASAAHREHPARLGRRGHRHRARHHRKSPVDRDDPGRDPVLDQVPDRSSRAAVHHRVVDRVRRGVRNDARHAGLRHAAVRGDPRGQCAGRNRPRIAAAPAARWWWPRWRCRWRCWSRRG